MRKLYIIVGTRPNFIKVTQFKRLAAHFPNIEVKLIHTGQHYDDKMANVFFDQFGLRPDLFLNIKPDHPGKQIAEMIGQLTNLFLEENPDMVMVVGDVNSTLAAAIAANKCEIPIAHLESGLRSNDNTMPEEHNRIVADGLAALHFVTEDSGMENLRRENKREEGIAFVGNTMIDTLVAYKEAVAESDILSNHGLAGQEYGLVTIHRPSNVDTEESLQMLMRILEGLTSKIKVVFPIHPRTLKNLAAFGLEEGLKKNSNIVLTEPLGYFDFQKLVAESTFVLTDSGGIQEETTYLGKPCLTLRPNTERPVTLTSGTNLLLPFVEEEILKHVDSVLQGKHKKGAIPKFWDGNATERVLQRVEDFFNQGF